MCGWQQPLLWQESHPCLWPCSILNRNCPFIFGHCSDSILVKLLSFDSWKDSSLPVKWSLQFLQHNKVFKWMCCHAGDICQRAASLLSPHWLLRFENEIAVLVMAFREKRSTSGSQLMNQHLKHSGSRQTLLALTAHRFCITIM